MVISVRVTLFRGLCGWPKGRGKEERKEEPLLEKHILEKPWWKLSILYINTLDMQLSSTTLPSYFVWVEYLKPRKILEFTVNCFLLIYDSVQGPGLACISKRWRRPPVPRNTGPRDVWSYCLWQRYRLVVLVALWLCQTSLFPRQDMGNEISHLTSGYWNLSWEKLCLLKRGLLEWKRAKVLK